mmetsp:Transcript_16005/g.40148  ORF Transcript_16005/g.40148 Transcript_16005/m.40148 type:complete len:953 (-) Transcript_16005:3083-5941(-)
MSVNSFDGLPPATKIQGRDYHFYQQLGAPTLVYEGSRRDDFAFRVPSHNLPTDNNRELHENLRRCNRVRARWQYGLDVDHVNPAVVPGSMKDKKTKHSLKPNAVEDELGVEDNEDATVDGNDDGNTNIFETGWMDRKQQQNRLSILLEDDTRVWRHKEYIENYAAFQHPYVKIESEFVHRKRKAGVHQREVTKIDLATYSKKQEFSISQKIDSDPSYLAPFDLEGINEATNDSRNRGTRTHKKTIQIEPPERLPQGNALLCVPCPCYPCSKNTQGYVVLHPKGRCLERLCVSNLVPPINNDNAGDIRNVHLSAIRKKTEFHCNAITSKPNEISLDDTILQIQQCGAWRTDNQQCIFAVRTGTHVSVVEVTCQRPDYKDYHTFPFPRSSCWGCYVLREKERLDLRSFSPKLPSFRPVSLTSHPRYGNALTPCKFAFASHSVGNSSLSTYNIVHNYTYGTERIAMTRHDITNLKSISFIDFSTRNPMCLWSAASSHVRPALAPGHIYKMKRQTKSPFGLGSSLFAIDLRTNSASFQWSPSAEEMTTEGVHSINGILTDWTRENTVFVTSSSAGKTYEIDGRMPCRAVNTWSLTSVCEESRDMTLPPKSFYGEPSLLTKPLELCKSLSAASRNDSPLVKVNTDFRTSGIHLFQKPLRNPRFQSDSLECVGMAELDTTGTASIATSSYFDLIDVSDDTYTCGISSIRLPLDRFVRKKDHVWTHFLEEKLHVLCTMTINNKGDIYCHSLLECNNKATVPGNCRRFDGLPIGTTAINIPTRVDGRTKLLKNGHWKPTGGMNLSLFLSNTYPIPQDTMISGSQEVVDVSGDTNGQHIFLDNLKKKRIDESADVMQIGKTTQKSALTIIGGKDRNGRRNEMLREDGEDRSLIMPLSLSQNVQRTTMVYEGSDCRDSDDSSSSTDTGTTGGKDRTDLSKFVIESTLGGWEDTPSDSESIED